MKIVTHVINVSFVCKLCRGSFSEVDEFIRHKRTKHFKQFQNLTAIVFEEKIVQQSSFDTFPIKSLTEESDAFDELHVVSDLTLGRVKSQLETKNIHIEHSYSIPDVNAEITVEERHEPNFVDSLVFTKTAKQPSVQDPDFISEITVEFQTDPLQTTDANENPCISSDHFSTPLFQFGLCEQEETVSGTSYNLQEHTSNDFCISSVYSEASVNEDAYENAYSDSESFDDIKPIIVPKVDQLPRTHNPCVKLNRLTKKQIEAASYGRSSTAADCTNGNDYNISSDFVNVKQEAMEDDMISFKTTSINNGVLATQNQTKTIFIKRREVKDSQRGNHICHICGKGFRLESYVRMHMVTHFNDRPYKCKYEGCDGTFKTRNGLAQHKKCTHSDSRPFKCPLFKCGKAFKTKRNLQLHVSTHTGDRPYKCLETNCGKSFLTTFQLTSHVERHHIQH